MRAREGFVVVMSAVANVRMKALRLTAIANELLAIASGTEPDHRNDTRRTHGDELDRRLRAGSSESALDDDHPLWAELAREHYRSRRRRDKIFPNAAMFGEPAWDILLDLFIAAKEGRRVSVMSACIGAAVPSTTGLRWISALENDGLLMREDDRADARRTFVKLSPKGYDAMVEYFAAAAKSIKGAALAGFDTFERAEHDAEVREAARRDGHGTPPTRSRR